LVGKKEREIFGVSLGDLFVRRQPWRHFRVVSLMFDGWCSAGMGGLRFRVSASWKWNSAGKIHLLPKKRWGFAVESWGYVPVIVFSAAGTFCLWFFLLS